MLWGDKGGVMVARMEMVVERKVRRSNGDDGVVVGDGDIKDDDGVISGMTTGIVTGTIFGGVTVEKELDP